jgi:hypothetical protein
VDHTVLDLQYPYNNSRIYPLTWDLGRLMTALSLFPSRQPCIGLVYHMNHDPPYLFPL